MKKIFNFILILGFLGIAFFVFHFKENTFSKEKVKLEIIAPSEASLLQEIEYLVRIKNEGDFRLDDPELIFIAPQGSIHENKILETKVLRSEELGIAIYPKEEKIFSFKIKLLGKEGEKKLAKAILTYTPKGLKSSYQSTTEFVTTLKTVPITFEFDLLSKIPAQSKFTFRINYFSNIEEPISNLVCKVEYPENFEFFSSFPPSLETTEWIIPILNKNQGGKIEITGQLHGEPGGARIFKASLGILKEGRFFLIKEISKGVELTKPTLFLRQEINNHPNYVASPGEWLHYIVYFKNIGDSEMTNLTIFSKLEGEAFDLFSIKSDTGKNVPGDNTIVFDWRNVPELQYLPPLAEGKVEFWVRVKENISGLKDPLLRHKVFVGESREEFVTKISTKVEIIQRIMFSDEIFGNSGPLPPRVGEITTFTIIWNLKNYYSDVEDFKVKARLSSNVEITGKIFPVEESSRFSFDSVQREVVWMVGKVKKGTGIFEPPKTISFQISLLPKEENRGKEAILIESTESEGIDLWTGTIVKTKLPSLTTFDISDPNFSKEKAIVQ